MIKDIIVLGVFIVVSVFLLYYCYKEDLKYIALREKKLSIEKEKLEIDKVILQLLRERDLFKDK